MNSSMKRYSDRFRWVFGRVESSAENGVKVVHVCGLFAVSRLELLLADPQPQLVNSFMVEKA